MFDVGRGAEYEFVQITTSPNEPVAGITDRMLLLLDEKDLIKTYEFNPDEWDISVEDPTKTPPRPRKPKAKSLPEQSDLF